MSWVICSRQFNVKGDIIKSIFQMSRVVPDLGKVPSGHEVPRQVLVIISAYGISLDDDPQQVAEESVLIEEPARPLLDHAWQCRQC